jgi:ABC-type multidrug transport system ATPase subunit
VTSAPTRSPPRSTGILGSLLERHPHAGVVFGFVGPNGAGKSTTIRCILDLLRPSAGEIRLFGRDPSVDGAKIRERVAYVPGELRLPERITARQFLESIGRLRSRFDGSRLAELADIFKLDLDRRIQNLSSGNRRKDDLAALHVGALRWPLPLTRRPEYRGDVSVPR